MKMTIEFHSHNWSDEAELYAKRSDSGCRGCYYNESGSNRCCPEIVDESENLCSRIGEEVEHTIIFVEAKHLNLDDISFGDSKGIKSYIHEESRHTTNDEGDSFQTDEVVLVEHSLEDISIEGMFAARLEEEKEKVAIAYKQKLEKEKKSAFEASQKKAKQDAYDARFNKVYDETAKRSRTWTDWDHFYDREYAKEFGDTI